MRVNATLEPSDTQHNVESILHVTDDRAPNGAFVVTTNDGNHVRWESLDESALTSLNEDLFDTQLRSLYRERVDVEYPREEPTPDIIAPELQTYTRKTMYLSAATKDELMEFYESAETEGAKRCHEQEATLRVALNHTDELVSAAISADSSCEERYVFRVEESTWRTFKSRLLELELSHPALEKCSKTAVYEALATVSKQYKTEFEQIAASLSK